MLRKLYNGNYSLPITYWVFGVLGNNILHALIFPYLTYVENALYPSTGYGKLDVFLPFLLSKILTGIVFIYGAMVLIGAYRALKKYQGSGFWKFSTAFSITLGGIALCTMIYLEYGIYEILLIAFIMGLIEAALKIEPSAQDIIKETKLLIRRSNEMPGSEFSKTAYLKIDKELSNKKHDRVLWLRLFSENNGDENRTTAHYIKERYKQIMSEGEA
jgi:hypothetical protein